MHLPGTRDNTAVLRTGSMSGILKAGRSLQWSPVYPRLVYLYLRCHATRRSAVRKRRRETADTSAILRDEASGNGQPISFAEHTGHQLMMPCGWERRHEDAARVLGLICSSADAAGPGFEPKGASASRLASQTVAPRPETPGNTPTAVLLHDLEDDGHVKPSAGG